MSKEEKRLKIAAGYERNVPRCGNCIYIRTYEKYNKPVFHKCNNFKYVVHRMSCCNYWKSSKGEEIST